MGIKELSKVVDTVVYIKIYTSLTKFAGKSIALDISSYLYKYVRSSGDRWIEGIIRLLALLKKAGIFVVVVFDGKDAPVEKEQTRIDRRAGTQTVKDKLEELDQIKENIYVNYYGKEEPLPEDVQSNVKYIFNRQRTIKDNKNRPIDFSDPIAMYKMLCQIESSWKRQTLDVSVEHANITKELVSILGFSQIQAKGEAETVCAYLWKTGVVDLVFSEDSDILAYGVEHSISKLDNKDEKVFYIHAPSLYQELDMTYEQFKDLCIFCGCDYNQRVKNYGPMKSLPLIQKYGSLEEIEANEELDLSPLNYEKCRELFTIPSKIKEKVIKPANFKLDKEALKIFLKKYGCSLKIASIEKYWEPVKIVVECKEEISDEEASPEDELGGEEPPEDELGSEEE